MVNMVNSATYTTFMYSERSHLKKKNNKNLPLTGNETAYNNTPYGFRMALDNKQYHVSVGVCEVCLGESLLCLCQHHML